MLNIDNELKQIYKNDILPVSDNISYKVLNIYFPELNLTITNNQIVSESFKLTESICSASEIIFGLCESSDVKLIIADVEAELTDKMFIITQTVNYTYNMPLGVFKVKSVERQSDSRLKKIVGYNMMTKFDIIVDDWYGSLTFPITLKDMRESLCNYVGIEYVDQNLVNDHILIEETIKPSNVKGRDILFNMVRLNGGFGQITRDNKFNVIILGKQGVYPSETLYPSNDLYPSESKEYVKAGYISSKYEDYYCKAITGVNIVSDDDDIGVTSGQVDNVYRMIGNYLISGKSANELQEIASNILNIIKDKQFRPHNTKMIGLPYIEAGDAISILTTNDAIETYVFTRTLEGIQLLVDTVTANGKPTLNNKLSLPTEILIQKAKTLKISKDVDRLRTEMIDLEEGLESQITQTAGQINQSVTDVKKDLQSQIDVQASEIELKVDANGVVAAINLTQGNAKIKANKIELEGTVTANGNFKINTDGTIEAINGKFSGIVEGATIKGSAFETYGNDGYFISSAWDSNQHGTWNLEVRIQNGEIEVGRTLYTTTGQTFEKSTTINYSSISTNKVYGTSVQGESADFKELTLGTVGGAGKVIFNSNYEFRPQVFSTNCKIGNSSYPWTEGHFKKVYVNGSEIASFDEKSVKALYPQSNSNSYYAYLNTSREFSPNTSSSSYPFSLGSPSYPWDTICVKSIRMQSGGTLGFFGITPTSRKRISRVSTSSTVTTQTVAQKLDELMLEMSAKGFIDAY